jgi:AbiV family abortive infection protein
MKSDVARAYFWALLDNATSLVEDAALLAERSPARAQALLILAYEELGKADWVHEAFWKSWQSGRSAALVVEPLSTGARHHGAKYLSGRDAVGVLYDLPIWVTFDELEPLPPESRPGGVSGDFRVETAAIRDRVAASANDAKQRGFYVDVTRDGHIRTPRDLEVYDLDEHRGHIAAGIVYLIGADQELVTRRWTSVEPADEIRLRADAHARYDDF